MIANQPAGSYGIVIAGHGSRDPEGVAEFERLADAVRGVSSHSVTYGFLEFATPTIDQAIRENAGTGVTALAVVPAVLLGAAHAKNDIPAEILALQGSMPEVALHYGSPLHLHPAILKLCRERIIEAEAAGTAVVSRQDTCLVVVGRGTTDPDANSDVSKLARMLQEGLGLGGVYVCYSGTARPLVADGLAEAVRLGYRRLIVFPFFLFTGVLIKRIRQAAEDLDLKHPGLEVLQAGYLDSHPYVVEALLERAQESVEGKAVMNCTQCKYRTQIVGYEKEVGQPQQGHHFHVRAGTSASPPIPSQPVAQASSPAPTPPAATEAAPHPIEAESFRVIDQGMDWSPYPEPNRSILQRLVHTTGDYAIVSEVYLSPGAAEAGIRALTQRMRVVTDVTMVEAGLRRALLDRLGIRTACLVHDEETRLVAEANGLTRSAAGIRRAWELYGNHQILAIGDAPTAVEEAVRLVREQRWRPALVIGLPVGFIGTEEAKANLRRCLHIPRITNRGSRGGSPWAAAVVNALMIQAGQPTPTKEATS